MLNTVMGVGRRGPGRQVRRWAGAGLGALVLVPGVPTAPTAQAADGATVVGTETDALGRTVIVREGT